MMKAYSATSSCWSFCTVTPALWHSRPVGRRKLVGCASFCDAQL
ncbi:Uncharacterised protein [Vibrio cholerae]|nr:Uncharacterised protein [Vibrio cholerae]